MMRRKIVTTPTARVCQTASLLLILVMVLGMLVEDIVRNAAGPDAAHAETWPVVLVSCLAEHEQTTRAERSLP